MSSCNARSKGNTKATSGHTKVSKNTATIRPTTNLAPTEAVAANPKKDIINEVNRDHDTSSIQIQNGLRSRKIKGQEVIFSKPTISKLVSEVIPQTNNVNPNIQHEQINWAKIQLCSTDTDFRGNCVIIIGLARGYQVFLHLGDGNFEEIISVRNAPLKIGHLLPFKKKFKDRFTDQRPFLALYAMENGSRVYSVNFLSLRSGKIAHQINCVKPIMEIDSSSNCLLIIMEESINIYEFENFMLRSTIKINSSTESSYFPSYSLSENLLAIADTKFIEGSQSVGGCIPEFNNENSSNNQMINTAKNISQAVTNIGESIVSSLSHTSPGKHTDNNDKLQQIDGIVSVINLEQPITQNKKQDCIAHFRAHFGSRIGHLMFGVGGQLLLTGCSTATVFNVFLLHFHPTASSLTSVQHIYTLNRGNTAAKVIESGFSFDNRWLTISTNHGTTHLFAINPYGGAINARTHCGAFMNREGKFEKTAGIRIAERMIQRKNSKSAKMIRKHPALKNLTIARTTVDPGQSTVQMQPISLNSVTVLKQRIFSTENLCAWASDNTPSILQTTKRRRGANYANIREFGQIFSSKFSQPIKPSKYPNSLTSLLVMNNEGVLTEYALRTEISQGCDTMTIKRNSMEVNSDLNAKNDLSKDSNTNNLAKFVSQKKDEKFQVKLSPTLQWELTRSKNTADFELFDPPLPSSNPLIRQCDSSAMDYYTSNEKPVQNTPGNWLPFLEVITYSGPHRRLWLGPQFSFSVYTSFESQASKPSIGQLEGMQKCCPVLIEKNSSHNILARKLESGSVARVICGSWSSEFDYKSVNEELSLVKDKIEDAMKEPSERGKKSENKDKGSKDTDLLMMDFSEKKVSKIEDNDDDDDACLMLSGIDL